MTPRVIVVGGGITGLAAAYFLNKQFQKSGGAVELTLLEASGRLGGKIKTELLDDLVIEAGPDSFVTIKPWALRLIEELGLSGELVKTNQEDKTVCVYWGGKMRALPEGMGLVAPRELWPFLRSDLLSWKGKIRLAMDLVLPKASKNGDESLAGFARRRLGGEALEKIVAPLAGGIYAGDPENMSLQSAFPQLKEFERRYGSLIRGMREQSRDKQSEAPHHTLFMTLKGGLSALTDVLVKSLPPETIRLNSSVAKIMRKQSYWEIQLRSGEILRADAVVSALPASVLSGVLRDQDPALSRLLGAIPFVSTATVSLAYDAKAFKKPPKGFGFVIPRFEDHAIMAATFTSNKFSGRAPAGKVLLRCFVGGAGHEGYAEAGENEIAHRVCEEIGRLLGLSENPLFVYVGRWIKANPQYIVGHEERLQSIESRLRSHPGFFLAGASYRGVGISDCIQSASESASRVLAEILAPKIQEGQI